MYDDFGNLAVRYDKKKDLREATHLSPSVIAKMGRDEPVNLETLALICRFLKCQIGDIVEIKA